MSSLGGLLLKSESQFAFSGVLTEFYPKIKCFKFYLQVFHQPHKNHGFEDHAALNIFLSCA